MKELLVLGRTIKAKRLALNLRMDDVANKAGITRATLWSIEKGQSNCSICSLFKVLEILGLSFEINNQTNDQTRDRATRINSALDKKINRFVIFCVEQYAQYIDKKSEDTYKQMKEKGVIDDLINDYEDLHGMSSVYLNDHISSLLAGE